MKAWDIRQGFVQPIFVNKNFEAGVTTIQSHPFVEHLVAVGRLVMVTHFKPMSVLHLYCPATTTQSVCLTLENHQSPLYQQTSVAAPGVLNGIRLQVASMTS